MFKEFQDVLAKMKNFFKNDKVQTHAQKEFKPIPKVITRRGTCIPFNDQSKNFQKEKKLFLGGDPDLKNFSIIQDSSSSFIEENEVDSDLKHKTKDNHKEKENHKNNHIVNQKVNHNNLNHNNNTDDTDTDNLPKTREIRTESFEVVNFNNYQEDNSYVSDTKVNKLTFNNTNTKTNIPINSYSISNAIDINLSSLIKIPQKVLYIIDNNSLYYPSQDIKDNLPKLLSTNLLEIVNFTIEIQNIPKITKNVDVEVIDLIIENTYNNSFNSIITEPPKKDELLIQMTKFEIVNENKNIKKDKGAKVEYSIENRHNDSFIVEVVSPQKELVIQMDNFEYAKEVKERPVNHVCKQNNDIELIKIAKEEYITENPIELTIIVDQTKEDRSVIKIEEPKDKHKEELKEEPKEDNKEMPNEEPKNENQTDQKDETFEFTLKTLEFDNNYNDTSRTAETNLDSKDEHSYKKDISNKSTNNNTNNTNRSNNTNNINSNINSNININDNEEYTDKMFGGVSFRPQRYNYRSTKI